MRLRNDFRFPRVSLFFGAGASGVVMFCFFREAKQFGQGPQATSVSVRFSNLLLFVLVSLIAKHRRRIRTCILLSYVLKMLNTFANL